MIAQFGFRNGELLLFHIELALNVTRPDVVAGADEGVDLLVQMQGFLHQHINFLLQYFFIIHRFFKPLSKNLGRAPGILFSVIGVEFDARQGRPRIATQELVHLRVHQRIDLVK